MSLGPRGSLTLTTPKNLGNYLLFQKRQHLISSKDKHWGNTNLCQCWRMSTFCMYQGTNTEIVPLTIIKIEENMSYSNQVVYLCPFPIYCSVTTYNYTQAAGFHLYY